MASCISALSLVSNSLFVSGYPVMNLVPSSLDFDLQAMSFLGFSFYNISYIVLYKN